VQPLSFLQAEDGIRDRNVTGVQTCASDLAAPHAGGARRTRRRWVAPYLFLLPAGVLFVAFLAIPIVYAVYLSFRGLKMTGPGPRAEEGRVGTAVRRGWERSYATERRDTEK